MVMEVIKERRSIRKYQDRPVEDEKLKEVLEAGRLAPSWENRQCWYFIVVKDQATKDVLSRESEALEKNPARTAIAEAPVVIVACADPFNSGVRGGLEYYLVDMGICFQQMVLEAWNQGLGTCWVGSFDEDVLRQLLDVPENIRIVAMTPLGYPDTQPESRGRKPMEDIVFHERWGQ